MRSGAKVFGATVLLAALAGGCSGGSPRAERTPSPADDGLNASDCVAPQGAADSGRWSEVACDDPVAVASVTEVQGVGGGIAGAMAEPECPEGTDHVLHATDFGFSQQKVTWSFICTRNLKPPHPGDPGEGGGPGIVAGDCVRVAEGTDAVEEVPCDGKPKATHRVTIVLPGFCPPGDDVSFKVGHAQFGDPLSQKVACAKKL